jgi:DNA-binding CsgD family transcriptional regulator
MGRDDELEAIRRLAPDRQGGGGSSLVIRGAPGLGKSALLEAAADELSERGWRVLRTGGAPSERRLPFAALHRLLRPIMGDTSRLFLSQRVALLRALGLVDGPAPSQFLVALAALDLLAEAAAAAPVLVLVDDTQWLDRVTAEVLGFVARRLESDPVLLLAAGREGYTDPLADGGLPELRLAALDRTASQAVLDANSPGLSAARRAIVLEAAGGNPLALIELPKALGDSFSQRGLLGGDLPMTDRLERAFATRVEELPAVVSDLVLLAALNDSDGVAEILSAAAGLGHDASVQDLGAAMAAGLIVLDQTVVRFRHPLIRSAIHQSASMSRRHAAHAALAEVLADQPSRRVWHQAASIVGPDEAIAAALEEAALRAHRIGAIDTAVAAFQRSAELSGVSANAGRRLLRASELAFELGEADLGEQLLRTVSVEAADRPLLEWVRELSDERVVGGAERVDALIESAGAALRGGDVDLALRLLGRAALRCWTTDLGSRPGQRVIAATDGLPIDVADPRRLAIRAYASPLEIGGEIIALLDRPGVTRAADIDGLHLLARAAACVGAFERAEALCAAAADGLREQARLVQLAQVLGLQAWAALRRSHWRVSIGAAEEAARLAEETRQPRLRADALAAQAMLAAMRGDSDLATRLTVQAEDLSQATGSNITTALIQNARAMIAASDGRPLEAFEHLWRIYQPTDPAYQRMQTCWAIGSLAESAIASGQRDRAATELAKLEALAAKTPATGVHIELRYARALLADPSTAEPLYLAALAPDLGDSPFTHARVQLSYGAWLRRQRRIIDARAPLRAAHETFERLGAQGWAEQARRELRAAGEDTARRPADSWYQLTAQETQIAKLVAEGQSNREIGRRLYVSHRTVASHLYRMFPKLGVSSRSQLARIAAAADD